MSADAPADAHRASEVTRLRAALATHEGLRIVAVSGPGGIGKSYLVRHVLESPDLANEPWLELTADGANEGARHDFFAIVEGQLAKANLPPPARPRHDYFPHVRKVAATHRALVDAVVAELGAGAAPQELKNAAIALLRTGRRLNDAIPKTRSYFDVRTDNAEAAEVGLNLALDEVWQKISGLRALRPGSVLPAPLRDALGLGMRARVRSDLYNVTADALIDDLAALLEPASPTDRPRFLAPAMPGVTRLLVVIDDFEALAPAIEEFVTGSLVPRLADAPFPSTLVILGRDDLEAMSPAWSQHCRQYISDQIRLAPFTREVAIDMLARAGVPEERREALAEATQGFPFLLSLVIDEIGAEGSDSALFLRRFFDRTTRWMSAREREWLSRVCYLDRVNVDTLRPLFPNEDPERIQDWFERESSIRDPSAAFFRVRPLIRDKILRYLELRSPKRHAELLELAQGAK
jgi:hypothetical protein